MPSAATLQPPRRSRSRPRPHSERTKSFAGERLQRTPAAQACTVYGPQPRNPLAEGGHVDVGVPANMVSNPVGSRCAAARIAARKWYSVRMREPISLPQLRLLQYLRAHSGYGGNRISLEPKIVSRDLR